MTRPSPLVNNPLYNVSAPEERRYHRWMLLLGVLPIATLAITTYAPNPLSLGEALPLIVMAAYVVAQGLASDPATVALWQGRSVRPTSREAIAALGRALSSPQHTEIYTGLGMAVLGMATSGDSLWMLIAPLTMAWWRYAQYVRSRHP